VAWLGARQGVIAVVEHRPALLHREVAQQHAAARLRHGIVDREDRWLDVSFHYVGKLVNPYPADMVVEFPHAAGEVVPFVYAHALGPNPEGSAGRGGRILLIPCGRGDQLFDTPETLLCVGIPLHVHGLVPWNVAIEYARQHLEDTADSLWGVSEYSAADGLPEFLMEVGHVPSLERACVCWLDHSPANPFPCHLYHYTSGTPCQRESPTLEGRRSSDRRARRGSRALRAIGVAAGNRRLRVPLPQAASTARYWHGTRPAL
jgi:hypothetical protein